MGDRGTGRGKKETVTRPKQPSRGRGRPPGKNSDDSGKEKTRTPATKKREPQKPLNNTGIDREEAKATPPETPLRRAKAQTVDEKGVTKKVSREKKEAVALPYGDPRTNVVSPRKNKRLNDVLEMLKMKKKDISCSSAKVNEIVDDIISECKKREQLFENMEKMSTGSYYEKVKISNPNEFDIMLNIPSQRVKLTEFGHSGAFYTLSLKRNPGGNCIWENYVDSETISPKKILAKFREIVKDVVSGMPVSLKRRNPSCPAITLLIENGASSIDVDLVLALEIKQRWPKKTENGMKIESWLGTKQRRNFQFKPFYMVPKQYDADCTTKDTWRISFSHIEKEIIATHGSTKTCCESQGEKCCRKSCLKLMKYLLELLKIEEKPTFNQFCSYFVKTTLLHQCSKYPRDDDWKFENLEECFNRCIDFFQKSLHKSNLPNFFIPSHNLLDKNPNCSLLYKAIEDQRKHNYPIFDS